MYTKTNWVDGEAGNTPINSARLNKLETGVKDAHDGLDALDPLSRTDTLEGIAEWWNHFVINDDGSDSDSWPNRLSFEFAGHLTGWYNEYGEPRATPAKDNTVAFRVFTRDQDTDSRSTSVPVLEVVRSRNVRTQLFGVMGDGLTYATAIEVRPPSGPVLKTGYLRLVGAAAVPANTPAGTLIIRTSS